MSKSICRSVLFLRTPAGVVAALPLAVLLVSLFLPVTVCCQRKKSEPDRGLAPLRALVASSEGRPAPADLLKIESEYAETRAGALAKFLRGYQHYLAKEYQKAAEALDVRSIDRLSGLGDYALFYRAESLTAAGSNGEALRDYGILYTKHPDSLKAREARLRASEMALSIGDPASALKELSRMIEDGDADAMYRAAQVHETTGKNDEAIRLYRRIYFESPATSARAGAEERLNLLGAPVKSNPGSLEEERMRSDALFEAEQYADAAAAYDQLVARFPETAAIDEIQFRRGLSQLKARMPAQAAASLARVSERQPELKAQALLHQAEALRRSNRPSEGALLVDRLASQYPKSAWAEEALYDLAKELDKQGRTAEANAHFRRLFTSYPSGRYAPEASYNLGYSAYKTKNYAEAARILEQHLASYRYPQTKFIGEAGFWAAKSEERLGKRARALALYDLVVERYRYGYHGYVAKLRAAALRSSDPGLKAEMSWPELDSIRGNITYVEPINETDDGSHSIRVVKTDDFEIIGLTDLAIKELNRAIEGAPTSPRLNLRLAQVYSRRGDNFQATLILRRGYPDIYSYEESDLPREAWEIFFPMVAWDAIKQEARRYGIDPFIAAGLIRQESVFNPKAVSRVGARGLMQVMPATGQMISRRQGNGTITASDLHNPMLNIKLGMNYLSQMLGEFSRIEYAAAAYNAGPGRARAWLKQRPGWDVEDWIEAIPFTETRGYVQGVLRYAANYRRFYKE
jgi:soluble lytic murein transglycosylase